MVSLGARPLAAAHARQSFPGRKMAGLSENGSPFDVTMRRPLALLSLGGSLGAQTSPPGFPQQNWRGGVGASRARQFFQTIAAAEIRRMRYYRFVPTRFRRRRGS